MCHDRLNKVFDILNSISQKKKQMEIPQEVLEFIFVYLDGKSLGRASQVNSTWRVEVKRVSEKRHIWKNICWREVPKNARDDIMKKYVLVEEAAATCESELDWRSVYVSWCQWPRLARYAKVTRELCTMRTKAEAITCAQVSGNCVITGHAKGHVMVWCRYKGLIGYADTNNGRITGMLLMDINGVAKNASVDDLGALSHDYVITTSTNGKFAFTMLLGGTEQPNGTMRLKSGPLIRRVHNQTLTEIRSLDKYIFSVTSTDNTMSMWKVTPSADEGHPLVELFGKCSLHPMAGDMRKLFQTFSLAKLLMAKNVETTIRHAESCVCDRCLITVVPPNSFMHDPKYFKQNIGIWMSYEPVPILHFAAMRHPSFTLKNYDSLTYLESTPSCFLLYGPVLFVGLDSGILLMYVTRETGAVNLLHLNKPNWRHAVARDRIIALDVNDGQFGLGVMASTSTQVFYVAFNTPESYR